MWGWILRWESSFLHTEYGEQVPVTLARVSGNVLLECHTPEPFLRQASGGRIDGTLAPGTFVRGVVIQEGAIFQLRDAFGLVADEVLRLTREEARGRLLDRIW